MTLPQRLKLILSLLILCISPSINNQAIPLAKYVKKPSEADIRCLAANLYHESRGEGYLGMLFVAHVVVNRMIERDLSACRVIMEPHQFTWWRSVLQFEPVGGEPREIAKRVLTEHENGVRKDLTKGAMWYHTTNIKPRWAKNFEVVVRYGNHIFYRRKE